MLQKFVPAMLFCLLVSGANAQDELPFSFGGFGGGDPEGTLEVSGEAIAVEPGVVDLQITVDLPAHNYIYSTTTPFGIKTSVKLTTPGLKAEGKLKADRDPKVVVDDVINETMEKFYDTVTWTQRVKISDSNIQAGSIITAELSGQYCSDANCLPIDPPAKFEATLPGDFVAAAATVAPGSSRITLLPEMRLPKGLTKPPVTFELSLDPPNAQVGEDVKMTVKAIVDRPYHIYSTTLSPDVLGGTPTEITIDQLTGLEKMGDTFVASTQPETKTEATGDVLEFHHDSVEWTRLFVATEEPFAVSGTILFQLCNESSCLSPTQLPFRLSTADPTSDAEVAAVASLTDSDSTASPEFGEGGSSEGLVPFVLTAISFGFIALLTPCVFPMIPVTISYFLKQGSDRPGGTVKLAFIYCLGIVGAFTVLGLLGAVIFGPTSLNSLANDKWLNLFFAAVFTMFGLMLLGMFEFRVPSWLLTWSSKKQETGGVTGVLFMALTFTLVSFTCTFAFVGQLLVLAARGDFLRPIIGMVAFSSAFASPFFFLALFPSMLKKLPKSGGWMNTVKVTMGLLELAIVAKFLSVADTGFSPTGMPRFLDYHLVMGSWIAVSAVTGLYLLGLFRMPHDSPSDSIGPLRCMFSLGFVGLAAYIAVGLFAARPPEGMLWQQIVAFAPPQINSANGDDGYFIEHDGLKYSLDFDAAVASAASDNKPMFLDFTGVNCINCRLMEKGVLSKEEIHSVLKDLVRVQLYVDQIPGVNREGEDYKRLLDRNHSLQENWFGDVAIPAYAITTPDGTEILSTFKGLDSTGLEFRKFLAAGLKRWDDRTASTLPPAQTTYKNVSLTTH